MINTIKVTSFNSLQLICTGKFDEEWLSEPNKIPTVAYLLLTYLLYHWHDSNCFNTCTKTN